MRNLDIAGYRRTRARLAEIYDMCSEIICDPATPPERKAELRAFRTWLHSKPVDQGYPNYNHYDDASRRAAALLDKPRLLRGVLDAPAEGGRPGEGVD
ncbi:hypothetical protein SAMN02799631_03254 [Methylobacterium sp. 174MFSha1.1]|uniref:hypothetical protein n=1 Tax=Methylobacterium sp. 174MFSha1.1 TaxID=1502749 RepID=UPI0008ED6F97|nr:hypothetical protein [Methylobacterium sp. 174MFSha1.1]SFU93582.1 hypothetical protein SAMN02799631_03254 [Methylobacterium sp. 174MFSha1.1]